MVKNYSDNLHSIKNTEGLTMKQMFDMSEKLISAQSDEIYVMKKSSVSLEHRGLRIFRFYIMLWKDEREPTIKLCMGR